MVGGKLLKIKIYKNMKTYKVGFWYTEYGTTIVEARNAKEAEDTLKKWLDESSLENLKYNCTDRDIGTQDAEEVKD